MQVFSTIIPIFAVVILGWFACRRGFMPPEFLGPANQLVYYLAIPALIFRSISKASFHTQFNMTVLLITLSSATIAYFSAWLIGQLIPAGLKDASAPSSSAPRTETTVT
jgi:predicted permease